MRRRLVALAAWTLTGTGLWLFGEAVWIHAKAAVAQELIRRAWTASTEGGTPARPWPWADTQAVARLEAPRHGVRAYVLGGTSGRNLAFGPTLVDGTAPPGKAGVTVIAGHRDTHFRFLEIVEPGDPLVLTGIDGKPHHYTVTGVEVADARDTRLRTDTARSTLVLVTCYPFDAVTPGGPLRYVVTATGG